MEKWYHGPRRHVATDGSAAKIAELSRTLLADARSTIFEDAPRFPHGRLVYHFGTKKLSIHVSSVRWYDRMLQFYRPSDVDRQAKAFVTEIRASTVKEHPRSTSEECKVKISETSLCRFRSECKNRGNCDYYHPPKNLPPCDENVPTDDGSVTRCDQWYHEKLLIDPTPIFDHPAQHKLGSFWFKARQELQRDLIIFPRKHTTNEKFAAVEAFWQMVLDIKAPYAVDYVAFNFGRWESNQHQNKHALDCHAHAHVVFTVGGAKYIAQRYPPFAGRSDAPTDYGIEDCVELEQQRLFFPMLIGLEARMGALEANMAQMTGMISAMYRVVMKSELPGSADSHTSSKICAYCNAPALQHCSECGYQLCEAHVNIHLDSAATGFHQLTVLED